MLRADPMSLKAGTAPASRRWSAAERPDGVTQPSRTGSASGRFLEEAGVGNGALPASARPAGGELDAELGPLGRDGQGT